MAAYNRAVQAANVSNATAHTNALAKAAAPSGSTAQGILQGQESAVNNLSYTPIDINALKKSTSEQAAQNAAQSFALEQQLSPGVASARSGLQKQVSDELALGGRLPADVAARVGRTAGAQAGASGVLGSQAPGTAAALGLTALDLANSRRANAASLLAANPLPVTGLSPEAVANYTVSDTNARNQFALSKTGAQSNLANSQLGFLGAQSAQEQAAQNAKLAAQPAPTPAWTTTTSAMPYIPLNGSSNTSVNLDLRGNPVGTSNSSQALLDLYAQQRKQKAASSANYAANPTALGPGY
jgi:hypothetical protein